jgi:thiol:disulfide interchange protein DsbD
MHPERRTLILTVILLLLFSLLGAQTFRFSVNPTELKAGDQGKISVRMTIPEGKHQSRNPLDDEYFKLSASHPDLVFGKTIFPSGYHVVWEEQWDYSGSVTLQLPFTVKASAAPGVKTVKVGMDYGLCLDSGQCEAPQLKEENLRLTVLAADPSAAVLEPVSPVEDSLAVAAVADTTAVSPVEAESAEKAASPIKKVLWYMLLAFLGGIIMNFTPCVLPVLTIRAMSIVNQAHEDRSQIFKHSMAYAAGVVASFIVLALVFIGMKLAGESVGWGFQFQNIGFTIALAGLIFVFAMALLDVFIITPPGMTAASKASAKKGVSGSFFGGVFAFLLATPCSAPLLGTAIGFAMGLSPILMLIFFALVGIGLAFPFILIGLTPKALKFIPKPGEWMNIFKEVMAFVLLWLVWTMLKSLLHLSDGEYLLKVIMFILSLGFAAWLYGRFVRPEHSKATQWIFSALTLALVLGSAFYFLPYTPAPVEEHSGEETGLLRQAHGTPEGWYEFSGELMTKLLAEDAPVFLDFGAAWCKNCQTNEKTVLFTEEIMNAFKAKGVVLVHGDYTRKNDEILKWITDNGRAGVPFNALYVKGREVQLFPELLTKSMVLNALESLPEVSK